VDDNLAKVVKAVDEVQKSNAKLGTVVVGVGGVEADFEAPDHHKLTTPLCVAEDKDGPEVQAEQGSGRHRPRLQAGRRDHKNFAFKDTKSAAEKAGEIAAAAKAVLK
jgi:hypothetical protein